MLTLSSQRLALLAILLAPIFPACSMIDDEPGQIDEPEIRAYSASVEVQIRGASDKHVPVAFVHVTDWDGTPAANVEVFGSFTGDIDVPVSAMTDEQGLAAVKDAGTVGHLMVGFQVEAIAYEATNDWLFGEVTSEPAQPKSCYSLPKTE